MILETSDIAMIKDVLEGYQNYIDKTIEQGPFVLIPMSPRFRSQYRTLQTTITSYLPLVIKALSDTLPPDMTMLCTGNNECIAFDTGQRIMSEATTEFQVRLWCWQQDYLKQSVHDLYVWDSDVEGKKDTEVQ